MTIALNKYLFQMYTLRLPDVVMTMFFVRDTVSKIFKSNYLSF